MGSQGVGNEWQLKLTLLVIVDMKTKYLRLSGIVKINIEKWIQYIFKNKIDKILPSDILHILLILLLFLLQPLLCKFPENKSFFLLFIAISAVVMGSDTVLYQHLLNEEIDCMGMKRRESTYESQVPGLCKWLLYGSMSETNSKSWGIKSEIAL